MGKQSRKPDRAYLRKLTIPSKHCSNCGRVLNKENRSGLCPACKSLQGKKSRRAGALFELKVRADLESKNWIVDRWSNQVDLEKGELVKAKSFMGRSRTNGFPDFVILKAMKTNSDILYKVCGIEVKMKGKLSKEEKEKCAWYLEKNIFAKIFIVSKGERGIKYEEFKSN